MGDGLDGAPPASCTQLMVNTSIQHTSVSLPFQHHVALNGCGSRRTVLYRLTLAQLIGRELPNDQQSRLLPPNLQTRKEPINVRPCPAKTASGPTGQSRSLHHRQRRRFRKTTRSSPPVSITETTTWRSSSRLMIWRLEMTMRTTGFYRSRTRSPSRQRAPSPRR